MSSAGYVRDLFHVCKWFAWMYGMHGTHGDQKRALDLPELELQRTVSCHVHAGNGTGSSARAYNHWCSLQTGVFKKRIKRYLLMSFSYSFQGHYAWKSNTEVESQVPSPGKILVFQQHWGSTRDTSGKGGSNNHRAWLQTWPRTKQQAGYITCSLWAKGGQG